MSTSVTGGDTNVVRYFQLRKASDGTAATGLTITGIDLQYTRTLAAAATKTDAIVGTGGATTHVDNKVFEINATSSPGLYMACFADAAFAAGAPEVILTVKEATIFSTSMAVPIDPPVNLTSIKAGQQSATDLKDFADDGYDPATNKVQGVVLVDTTTTNTDMVGTDLAALASGVFLADGNHGGTSAKITLERIIVASTTNNQPGIKVTGDGTGAGVNSTGGASGSGMDLNGGGTFGDGLQCKGTSTGRGIQATGGSGASAHGAEFIGGASGVGLNILSAAVAALQIQGGSNSTGALSILNTGTDAGIKITSGATGHGIEIIGGGTSGDAVNASAAGSGGEFAGEVELLAATQTTLDATAAELATVDGIVDAILSDTNELQTDDIPTLISTAQDDLDTITGSDGVLIATGQTADAWSALEDTAGSMKKGTAKAGTLTTTTMSTTLTEADDVFNDQTLIFNKDTTTVALRRQKATISDHENTNGVLTFSAITTAPSATETFTIV